MRLLSIAALAAALLASSASLAIAAPASGIDGIMSTVNLTEVLAKMVDAGVSAEDAMADIEALGLNLTVAEFDRDGALSAAALRARTKPLGLSLGDRACLATARSRALPVLTADQSWAKLEGFAIILAR